MILGVRVNNKSPLRNRAALALGLAASQTVGIFNKVGD
jgi:hypothetical protein